MPNVAIGLGVVASDAVNGVAAVTSGTIDNAIIGGTTAAAATVTALTATGTVALSPASANVVISPTGTGVVTVSPATAGTLNNVSLGQSTPLAVASTTLKSTITQTIGDTRLLGKLVGANLNSVLDQAIPIGNAASYIVRRITLTNVSTSLGAGVTAGGFYNATTKPAGGILVAATQIYTALTGATKIIDTTLASLAGTDVQTAANLYLSLTIAFGSAATADVYIFGDVLS